MAKRAAVSHRGSEAVKPEETEGTEKIHNEETERAKTNEEKMLPAIRQRL